MGALLRRSLGDHVLGPDKPAVARIKNLFIRKIVLKLPLGSNLRQTHALLYQVRDQLTRQPVYRQLQVFFDVDPD